MSYDITNLPPGLVNTSVYAQMRKPNGDVIQAADYQGEDAVLEIKEFDTATNGEIMNRIVVLLSIVSYEADRSSNPQWFEVVSLTGEKYRFPHVAHHGHGFPSGTGYGSYGNGYIGGAIEAVSKFMRYAAQKA